MESHKLPEHYQTAEGPEGLLQVLLTLKESAAHDPASVKGSYILYQHGQQQSLIKVDMSEQPFQFWYYDLLGRPATKVVKETIADFLWEHCGEREQYFQEQSIKERL